MKRQHALVRTQVCMRKLKPRYVNCCSFCLQLTRLASSPPPLKAATLQKRPSVSDTRYGSRSKLATSASFPRAADRWRGGNGGVYIPVASVGGAAGRPESADGLRAKAWLQSRSDAARWRPRDLPRSLSPSHLPKHQRAFSIGLLRRNRHLPAPANDSDRSSPAPARSMDHYRPAGSASSSLRSTSSSQNRKDITSGFHLILPGASYLCSSIRL